MATLIHNATVIAPDAREVRVLREHSLAFESGQITELAPAQTFDRRLASDVFEHVVLADRHIIVPGFVNTHHHLYQSLTRGVPAAQNQHLFDWLLTLYEYWRGLDFAAVRAAARVSIGELLVHGCTTTVDHFYMFPPARDVRAEAVLEAANELGIRIHLGRGAMTLGRSRGGLPPDDVVETDDAALAACERVLDAWHDPAVYALQRIDLAPCSPFNVSREHMRATRDLARQRGVRLHTHLAETRAEDAYCREHYGCRPLEFLDQLDWLGPDVYLAHCVQLNDAEIDRLAATGTSVSHNPASNLRLGSGIPPIEKMLAAGVNVGLAVDGSSSNDGGNLLEAARLALLIARVRNAEADQAGEPTLMPAVTAFQLLTTGGAACLNRPELGHLNPGAAADIAMFRRDDLSLAGAVEHDPLAALILCDAPRADRVYINGRCVVEDGRLALADEQQLAARLNEIVARRFTRPTGG